MVQNPLAWNQNMLKCCYLKSPFPDQHFEFGHTAKISQRIRRKNRQMLTKKGHILNCPPTTTPTTHTHMLISQSNDLLCTCGSHSTATRDNGSSIQCGHATAVAKRDIAQRESTAIRPFAQRLSSTSVAMYSMMSTTPCPIPAPALWPGKCQRGRWSI